MRTGVVAVGGAYSSVVEWFGGAGRPEGTVPCGGRCGAWWSLRCLVESAECRGQSQAAE